VAGDIADDQGDPGARQRDHVEPVAADPGPGVGGQVAGGDLHGRQHVQVPGQQAALQGQRGRSLTRVAAPVVDGDGCLQGQLGGCGQIVVLIRRGLARAPEAGYADQPAVDAQRAGNQRVDAVVQDRPGRLGTLEPPLGGGPQVRLDPRTRAAEEAGFIRHARDQCDQRARRAQRSVVLDAATGHPAQLRTTACLRLLALQRGRCQVDGDVVGEPGDSYLHQLLRSSRHVQGRANGHAGLVQQVEVPVSRSCSHPLAPAADGQFRHSGADSEQQQDRLVVRGAGSGERLIRRNQEEIEPERGRHRRYQACDAEAGGGYRDHDHRQDKSRIDRVEAVPHRHQDCRDSRRRHHSTYDRYPRPPCTCVHLPSMPRPVPGIPAGGQRLILEKGQSAAT
jgi:hypothetical protein